MIEPESVARPLAIASEARAADVGTRADTQKYWWRIIFGWQHLDTEMNLHHGVGVQIER